MHFKRLALVSGSLALALSSGCPSALGAEGEPESAAELDAEGTALLNQREFNAACPKLARSFRLQPGTGVLLRLALCHELSGKQATAWTLYLDAADRARAKGDARVAELAQRRATALDARVSRVTIHLDPSAQNASALEVSRDGEPLELTRFGTALPVDPGPHSIIATAPGRKRFEETLVVSASPTTYSITITLPRETPSTPEGDSSGSPERESKQRVWSTQRSLAVASAGVGVAGIAVGAILGLGVSAKMNRARSGCSEGNSGCSPEALALQDQAHSSALASTIAFGVGAAGIVGGIALWLTAPKAAGEPTEVTVQAAPLLGFGTAGVQAVGRW